MHGTLLSVAASTTILLRAALKSRNYNIFPDHVSHRGEFMGWDKAGFYPPSGLCKSSNQRWLVQKVDITPNMQPTSSQVSHAFQMEWAWSHFPHKLCEERGGLGVKRGGLNITRVKEGLVTAHFASFYIFTSHLAPERWWILSGWWSAHQQLCLSLTWEMTHERGINFDHPINGLTEDS